MRYKQTKKARTKEHVFYLSKILLVLLCFTVAIWWFYDGHINLGVSLSAGALIGGLTLVLKNYLPFVRHANVEDYIEVEGDSLVLTMVKYGSERFPLDNIVLFKHFKTANGKVELVSESGSELNLEGYENMDKLVQELRGSSAGEKYELRR